MDISIKGLSFSYSSEPVLKDVDLEISGPQLVSIVGPNGVGKSTLIHCIDRILVPTEGEVLLDGIDVANIPVKELAKKIGYVPYTSSNSFPLTVVDTVLMGRNPHTGWRTTDRDLDVVYDTLRMLGIEDLAMRSFNELSAGQHQKVMIARGLVQEPSVLLLDEPTANLDIKHQMEVTRLLRDLSRSKEITVVMISHDLNIAAGYSDKVVMLKDGMIYAVGTPEEVITEENLRAVYEVESKITLENGRPRIQLVDDAMMDTPPPERSFVKGTVHRTGQDSLGDVGP